jgi:hypothetical protein
MRKVIAVFMLIFLCNIIRAHDFLTEIVINGNISYLDNLLEVDQINDFNLNELRILRNTIFAKYGYKFASDDLANHFSQFAWYEATKVSVENELSSIDWKNIRLIQILENYYPTKIDYIFNFKHNGIYKLDGNFILTPIYTDNDANIEVHWAGSYDHYTQLDDFFFFHFDGRKTLFHDHVANYFLDIGNLGIVDVLSIYYQSKNTLVVNALSYSSYQTGSQIPISVELNLPNGVIKDESVGRTVNVPEDIRAREFIYRGKTMLTNGSIENYFYHGFVDGHGYVDEYVKEHLFTAFDKNIIVLLENSYLWGEYEGQIIPRGIPEGLGVNIIYNNIYNVYFIMVIHAGWVWGSR